MKSANEMRTITTEAKNAIILEKAKAELKLVEHSIESSAKKGQNYTNFPTSPVIVEALAEEIRKFGYSVDINKTGHCDWILISW